MVLMYAQLLFDALRIVIKIVNESSRKKIIFCELGVKLVTEVAGITYPLTCTIYATATPIKEVRLCIELLNLMHSNRDQ